MADVANLDKSKSRVDRFISDVAIEKIRKFTGTSLAHLPDLHIRDMLDSYLGRPSHREEDQEWWEDDRIYGIVLNTVVRINDCFDGSTRKFYAVLRKNENGNSDKLAVITVIDEAESKASLRDKRWLTDKPDRSKHTYAGYVPPTIGEVTEEKQVKEDTVVSVEKEELAEFIVVTEEHGTHYLHTKAEVEQHVYRFIGDGENFDDIHVYKKLPVQMSIIIGGTGE